MDMSSIFTGADLAEKTAAQNGHDGFYFALAHAPEYVVEKGRLIRVTERELQAFSQARHFGIGLDCKNTVFGR